MGIIVLSQSFHFLIFSHFPICKQIRNDLHLHTILVLFSVSFDSCSCHIAQYTSRQASVEFVTQINNNPVQGSLYKEFCAWNRFLAHNFQRVFCILYIECEKKKWERKMSQGTQYSIVEVIARELWFYHCIFRQSTHGMKPQNGICFTDRMTNAYRFMYVSKSKYYTKSRKLLLLAWADLSTNVPADIGRPTILAYYMDRKW